MKRFCLFILMLWLYLTLGAVTLSECLSSLRQNSPLAANQARVEAQKADQDGILATAYYPSLSVIGDIGYNSEVTQISFGTALPIKPPIPDKDRESVGVEMRQLIWDSGLTSLQKKANSYQSQAKLLEVQASLHQSEMEASALYYQILSFNASLEILQIQQENLLTLQGQVEAAKEYGLRENTDVLYIRQDILNVEDKIAATINNRNSAVKKLAQLCNLELQDEDSFVLPNISIPPEPEFTRAELKKLEAIASANKVNSRLALRKNYPQIMAKATASFGKPGYDMFTTESHDYYSLGLSFSWKIWDFGQRNKESRIAIAEAEMATANQENLLISLQNEIDTVDSELQILNDNIRCGSQKVELLQEIVAALNSKHSAGTITTTELLIQTNNLHNARLEVEYSRIKLSSQMAKKALVLGVKL